MSVELMRRAGELTRYGRASTGPWERVVVVVRRAGAEIDHRRHPERRRRRAIRLAVAGIGVAVAVGAGTALALTRTGLLHRVIE